MTWQSKKLQLSNFLVCLNKKSTTAKKLKYGYCILFCNDIFDNNFTYNY